MGRPPCCDKVGVKKGPWTPEEDIMLVSYVQEHGPGNWKAVPTSTGLRRCSKSCRLRWANYLRPGIKRDSFTDEEEKMIIQLQALMGNKWAAISSYLPERTDNDIKNYWNTHLKKKLKKNNLRTGSSDVDHQSSNFDHEFSSDSNPIQWESGIQVDIDIDMDATIQALYEPVSRAGQAAISYASSTGNIARLLKEWMKTPPKGTSPNVMDSSCISEDNGIGLEAFETSNSDGFSGSASPSLFRGESDRAGVGPFASLENWLIDDQGRDCWSNCTFDETRLLI